MPFLLASVEDAFGSLVQHTRVGEELSSRQRVPFWLLSETFPMTVELPLPHGGGRLSFGCLFRFDKSKHKSRHNTNQRKDTRNKLKIRGYKRLNEPFRENILRNLPFLFFGLSTSVKDFEGISTRRGEVVFAAAGFGELELRCGLAGAESSCECQAIRNLAKHHIADRLGDSFTEHRITTMHNTTAHKEQPETLPGTVRSHC